jgi:hypothetical protein
MESIKVIGIGGRMRTGKPRSSFGATEVYDSGTVAESMSYDDE